MLWLIWLALGLILWVGAFALDRPQNFAYWPAWLQFLPFFLMAGVPVFLVLPYFGSRSLLWGTLALIAGTVCTFAVAASYWFTLKGKRDGR